MSQAKYVRCSLETLSNQLADLGHPACPAVVGDLLRGLDYHLYVNVKRFTGPYHPQRDQQFGWIQILIDTFRDEGLPILSVDSKKKELIGNFANAGATWGPQADVVNAHDFLTDALYQGRPYGLYDVLANKVLIAVRKRAIFAVW